MTKLRVGDVIGYVYRCYDIDGRLVYTGSTSDIAARLHVHRRQNPASDRFAVVLYWVMPLSEARRLEVDLIHAERPPLNREHNPDYTGLPTSARDALFRQALDSVPVAPVGPHLIDGRTQAEVEEDELGVLAALDRLLSPA